MTVSDFLDKLIELEEEGKGSYEVWMSEHPLSSRPRRRTGAVGLACDEDEEPDIVIIEPAIE